MTSTSVSTAPPPRGRRRRLRQLSGRDRTALTLMSGVPLLLSVCLVWLPALATVALSFFNWTGIGGFAQMKPAGLENYRIIFSIYPEFPPAIEHNLLWLGVFFAVPAPFGLFLALQLHKNLRFSRIYQSIREKRRFLCSCKIGRAHV